MRRNDEKSKEDTNFRNVSFDNIELSAIFYDQKSINWTTFVQLLRQHLKFWGKVAIIKISIPPDSCLEFSWCLVCFQYNSSICPLSYFCHCCEYECFDPDFWYLILKSALVYCDPPDLFRQFTKSGLSFFHNLYQFKNRHWLML